MRRCSKGERRNMSATGLGVASVRTRRAPVMTQTFRHRRHGIDVRRSRLASAAEGQALAHYSMRAHGAAAHLRRRCPAAGRVP